MAGQTDGIPYFTDGDEPDLSEYTQTLVEALISKFAGLRQAIKNARDEAFNHAEDAHKRKVTPLRGSGGPYALATGTQGVPGTDFVLLAGKGVTVEGYFDFEFTTVNGACTALGRLNVVDIANPQQNLQTGIATLKGGAGDRAVTSYKWYVPPASFNRRLQLSYAKDNTNAIISMNATNTAAFYELDRTGDK